MSVFHFIPMIPRPPHPTHLIWSQINKRLKVTWATFEFRLFYLVHKYYKASFNTDIYCRSLRLVLTSMWTPRDGVPVTRSIGALCISGPCHDQYWQLTCPCQLSVQQCSAHNTHPGTCQHIWVVGGSTTKAASINNSDILIILWLWSKEWHVDTFNLIPQWIRSMNASALLVTKLFKLSLNAGSTIYHKISNTHYKSLKGSLQKKCAIWHTSLSSLLLPKTHTF